MKQTKKIDVLLAAFCGGMALSVLELLNVITQHPQDLNIYFFAGMAIAGFVGLGVSFFLKGDTSKDSAFFTGIAAPQLLGAVVKTGSTVTQVAFYSQLSFFPMAYAGTTDVVIEDSTTIEITVKGTTQSVTIQNIYTKEEYTIKPNVPTKIPYSDSLKIRSNSAQNKDVSVNKKYIVDNTKKLDVVVIPKQRTNSVFHGLFAQQYVAHDSFTKKITVNEIEQKKKPLFELEIIDSNDTN